MSEEITDEEILEFCKDFFKKIKEKPESYVKIVIGKYGCGAVYTLQELREEFKQIVVDNNSRDFELEHKRFIDKDWVFYFSP